MNLKIQDIHMMMSVKSFQDCRRSLPSYENILCGHLLLLNGWLDNQRQTTHTPQVGLDSRGRFYFRVYCMFFVFSVRQRRL